MSNIDYKFKAECLSSPDFQDFKKFRKIISKFVNLDLEQSNVSLIEYENALFFMSSLEEKKRKEFERLYKSYFGRRKRLENRIENLIQKPCLFLTMTFNEDTLHNTTDKSRREYIRRFLKKFEVPFVANIDFGKKNGREHYHGILQIEKIDYHLYTFGAINGIKINYDDLAKTKLSKYIAKLTNHAIKETTKRQHLIYSR